MASAFNRYYDPTTDQFISVDPAVATTGRPYAFVNDSPLNSTDPLGLGPVAYGGNTHADTVAVAKALAAAKVVAAAVVKAGQESVAAAIISDLGNAKIAETGTIADAFHEVVKYTSGPFDSISSSDATKIVEGLGVAAGKYATAVTAIGGTVNYWNDVFAGDSPYYAAGDTLFSLGGATLGATLCGAPADGVGVVCGIFAGFAGGYIGHKIFKWIHW